MIQTYIKLAWRNIIKRSFYSILNIIGLSIGLVFSLMIGIYVWNEFQVNRTLNNSTQHYFLKSKWKDPNTGPEITAPGPLSKRLKEEYPDLIANYYRWDGITSVVSKGDKHFRENIQIGDSTFLSMYGFKLLHGNALAAFADPYSIVISKDIALKYFSKTEVVGQTLNIQSFSNTVHDFIITGVLDDLPENSVTRLNTKNNNTIFTSLNTSGFWDRNGFEIWENIYIPSYVQLNPGATIDQLNMAVANVLKKHAPEPIRQSLTIVPVALTDYYLQKDNNLVSKMLYALLITGLFILLMAVVNFVNISVNTSSSRIKEIGVRRVLGSAKFQIIIQFLSESVILVAISSAIAIASYPLLKDVFADVIGKPLPGFFSLPVYFPFTILAFTIGLGILSGLYPAFVLSSHKPVDSLKGNLNIVGQGVGLRKLFAGLQFCIAMIVMIGAFIISEQVNYFLNEDLGYEKDLVVSSQVPRDWSPKGVSKMETIRNELSSLPNVKSVSLSYEIPDGNNGGQRPMYRAGADETKAVSLQMLVTDEHYLDTYGIKLKYGSFFTSGGKADLKKIILNETAVMALGWKSAEDAVGREVRLPEGDIAYTVQGVTYDFHFNSKHAQIQPIVFFNTKLSNNYRFLSFKIAPGSISATLDHIQQKWSQLMPGSSFEYGFMDDALRGIYEKEIQMKRASDAATVLSFIIALLGIFGLVSLNVQKKSKEMSIRKVLGADILSIVNIFIREFILVICISAVISFPVAWFIMNKWLSDYAYRVEISIGPFLVTLLILTSSTALLIVSQTIKTALAKPVKSLRAE